MLLAVVKPVVAMVVMPVAPLAAILLAVFNPAAAMLTNAALVFIVTFALLLLCAIPSAVALSL